MSDAQVERAAWTQNVVKECGEEASIPLELARRAKPAGVVTYETLGPRGVGRDVLFVYDLELPEDFVPVPQDGEVEEFALMEIDEVREGGAGMEDGAILVER